MRFKFGAPQEKSSSNESDKPRDLSRRRALKLGAAALTVGLTGSSKETGKQPLGTFAERFQAGEQLNLRGITDFQRQAYKPGVSEVLAKGVNPFNYDRSLEALVKRLLKAPSEFLKDGSPAVQAEQSSDFSSGGNADRLDASSRLDAWRFYLGLPQQHGTFEISSYQPEKHTEDIYYYRIKDFVDAVTQADKRWFGAKDTDPPTVRRVVELLQENKRRQSQEFFVGYDSYAYIMQNFKMSLGEDTRGTYFSYYDRWDLDQTPEGESGFIGKPFEIYDRIYYNPKTFEVVEPKAVSPEVVA